MLRDLKTDLLIYSEELIYKLKCLIPQELKKIEASSSV